MRIKKTIRYVKDRPTSLTLLATFIVLLSINVSSNGWNWNDELPHEESWIISRAEDDNVTINETMISKYELDAETGGWGSVSVAQGQCSNGIDEACQYMLYKKEYHYTYPIIGMLLSTTAQVCYGLLILLTLLIISGPRKPVKTAV